MEKFRVQITAFKEIIVEDIDSVLEAVRTVENDVEHLREYFDVVEVNSEPIEKIEEEDFLTIDDIDDSFYEDLIDTDDLDYEDLN